MWKIKRYNKSIHIILHADRMLCYAIWPTHNKITITKKEYLLEQYYLTAALLFNPTQLYHAIKRFIIEQQCSNPPIYFVLCNPLIDEAVYKHHKHNALLQDLIKPNYQNSYYFKHIASYEQQSFFYICSIAKTLLLQVQLLCARLPIYLQAVRPPLSIQYDLYLEVYRQDICQAELIQKIDYQNIEFKDLFANPAIYDVIYNKMDLEHDKNLAYALGSFIGAHR